MSDTLHRLIDEAPGIIAVLTFGVVALLGVLGGGQAAGIVAIVGWFILTPMSAMLGNVLVGDEADEDEWYDPTESTTSTRESTREQAREPTSDEDPVDALRERYARGEIDEVEFERRLETLIATEGSDAQAAHDQLRSVRSGRQSVDDELDDLLDDSDDLIDDRARERE
jgi:hypothetical protein